MVKVAFQGCCHGELDKIYAAVDQAGGADIVLIGGDFQSIRNNADLNCINVPPRFLRLGDFHEYYSMIKKAKYLTVFIGGNHEASNYLSELFYGGWVAPNIYYLGSSASIIFKGLRICGISGIYNFHNFKKGHFEIPPYNQDTICSVYHVRRFEINKLACITSRPDIMMSHDWPNNIEKHGDVKHLLKIKPYFRKEVHSNSLGSPPLEFILNQLQPYKWLSAHLHVHFKASFAHKNLDSAISNKLPTASNKNLENTEEIVFENTKNTDKIVFENTKNADEIVFEATENGDEFVIENTENADEIVFEFIENTDEIVFDLESPGNFNNGNSQAQLEICPSIPVKKIKLQTNEEEIDLGDVIDTENVTSHVSVESLPVLSPLNLKVEETVCNATTEFLALDKCISKHRTFIEFQEIAQTDSKLSPIFDSDELYYDIEWLAITKAFQPFMSLKVQEKSFLDYDTMYNKIAKEQKSLRDRLKMKDHEHWYPIPHNFKIEALTSSQLYPPLPSGLPNNSQTQSFCDLLDIPNHLNNK